MDDINGILNAADAAMDKAVKHTSNEFTKVRAGKASPNMLDGVMVDYYGNPTPLNQVGAVSVPDGRTIMVKPWEPKMISAIEKAIIDSNLGLNPQNDGEAIRMTLPPLSGDRRLELVKQVKGEAESGKVSLRNVRKDSNDKLRKLKNDGVSEDEIKKAEAKVQKMTDKHVAQIEELLHRKEGEIMTV